MQMGLKEELANVSNQEVYPMLRCLLITFAVFMAIDMVWLGFVAKNYYQTQMGPLLRPDVNWPVALGFYILYAAGLVYFVIYPNLAAASSLAYIGMQGALLGLLCYATYDLTNLAVLANWPKMLSIIDMLWGATLSGTVCFVSAWLNRMWT